MFKSVPQILKSQKSSVLGLSRLRPQLLISHRAILNSISQVAFKARFSTIQTQAQPVQESIQKENNDKQPENDLIRQKQNEVATTVNNAIKGNISQFKNSVPMKKVVSSLKELGITLNYYDSLMFLTALQLYDPMNPLLKDYKLLVSQEKLLLKEILAEPQLPQYLVDNYNIGKLLMFLASNVKSERNWRIKEAEAFSKALVEKAKDPLFILDYFGYKYAALTYVTPHSKPDVDVHNILKAYIISCKEFDCFKDILKETKTNDYKLTPFIERSLLSIANSLSSILHFDRSNHASFQPYIHWFLNLCTQLCYVTELGSKVSARILDLVFQVKESTLKLDISHYGELILFTATEVNKNLHDLTCERFTRLFFIYSRINFFHFSKSAYNDYINQAIIYLHEKQNDFTAEQWKSNIYAMGFNSIWTPQVQDIYDNLLSLNHLKEQRTYRKYSVYLKNLLLSALNNFALENGERLSEILQYLIKEVKMHEKGSKYYDLISFIKIAQGLRRAECLDLTFWKACFDVLPEAVKNEGLQYDLLFMIKSIELFANHPESQEQYKEIYGLLQDFAKKHKDVYDKISNFDVQELAQKLPEAHESVSSLQHQINLLLKKLDFPFEEEAKANFMVVDFLIPSKKMILELQGPTHYIKPDLKRMNRVTVFKVKCLEKMGYKVISIPFNSVATDDVSLDHFIMEQIEKNE